MLIRNSHIIAMKFEIWWHTAIYFSRANILQGEAFEIDFGSIFQLQSETKGFQLPSKQYFSFACNFYFYSDIDGRCSDTKNNSSSIKVRNHQIRESHKTIYTFDIHVNRVM